MPAVLVELGFIDSADVWLLEEHQEDMAKAVACGVRTSGKRYDHQSTVKFLAVCRKKWYNERTNDIAVLDYS